MSTLSSLLWGGSCVCVSFMLECDDTAGKSREPSQTKRANSHQPLDNNSTPCHQRFFKISNTVGGAVMLKKGDFLCDPRWRQKILSASASMTLREVSVSHIALHSHSFVHMYAHRHTLALPSGISWPHHAASEFFHTLMHFHYFCLMSAYHA